MTEVEILRTRFLDWLCDHRPRPNTLTSVGQFEGIEWDDPAEVSKWWGIVRQLHDEGLIVQNPSLVLRSTSVSLTSSGRSVVEQSRARRTDLAQRRAAVQTAVLRWLYNHPGEDQREFFAHPDAYFEGYPFETGDFDDALRYLRDKGLIRGMGTAWQQGRVVRPELKAEGVDCVEQFGGSVRDYLNRTNGPSTGTSITVHGNNSGQIAVGNRDANLSVSHGVAAEELAKVVSDIVAAIPNLGLGTDDAERLREAARQVGTELQAETPDKSWLGRLADRMAGVLERAAASTVAMGLNAGLRLAVEKYGLPAADG
jgi:hypothetical protein